MKMRAKFRVTSVERVQGGERLKFSAVVDFTPVPKA